MQRDFGAGRRLVVLALVLSLFLASCRLFDAPLGLVVSPGLRTLYRPGLEGGFLLANYVPFSGSEEARFAYLEGAILLALAWEAGMTILDLVTGDVLYEYEDAGAGPAFGAAAYSEDPLGAGSAARLFLFGLAGLTILKYDTLAGSFLASQHGSSPVYDVLPAAATILARLLTKVQPQVGVRFLEYAAPSNPPFITQDGVAAEDQAFEGGWVLSDEVLPAGSFTGELVSAFVADDDLEDPAPALVLTRGVTSLLYLDDRDGDAPVQALELGLDARKLRCVDTKAAEVGWLCAVSLFGDDQLALLNWDGENLPVSRGTVDVGDGPVGIDVRLLENGEVAIVSTGFNDNTVTEVRVTNTGGVLAVQERNAPAGCEGAGHAVYFEDDDGLALVGTCYTTGKYYVYRSVL